MPLTTREAVVMMAPELAAYPEGDDWTQALADADLEFELGGSTFGNRSELAARLLVAHLMTVRKSGGGTGGRVQSESIGGVISRTYASSNAAVDGELERSTYGMQLLRLMRVSAGGPRVT